MIIGFNAATLGAPVHQISGTMPVALPNDGGLAFTHLLGPAWNDQTTALSTYLRTFQPSSFTDLVFVRHTVGLGYARPPADPVPPSHSYVDIAVYRPGTTGALALAVPLGPAPGGNLGAATAALAAGDIVRFRITVSLRSTPSALNPYDTFDAARLAVAALEELAVNVPLLGAAIEQVVQTTVGAVQTADPTGVVPDGGGLGVTAANLTAVQAALNAFATNYNADLALLQAGNGNPPAPNPWPANTLRPTPTGTPTPLMDSVRQWNGDVRTYCNDVVRNMSDIRYFRPWPVGQNPFTRGGGRRPGRVHMGIDLDDAYNCIYLASGFRTVLTAVGGGQTEGLYGDRVNIILDTLGNRYVRAVRETIFDHNFPTFSPLLDYSSALDAAGNDALRYVFRPDDLYHDCMNILGLTPSVQPLNQNLSPIFTN